MKPSRCRSGAALVFVWWLTASAAVAAPRTVTLRGTIEDADARGKRLNGMTVTVMVDTVTKGASDSKRGLVNGKQEDGVYEFDIQIDDTNPVITVWFEDTLTGNYLDDRVKLLVGEPSVTIPKAMLHNKSPRVTAAHVRTQAESLRRRVVQAYSDGKSKDVRKEFGNAVDGVVRLSADRGPFDAGLQAEIGALVKDWDDRPSTALSSGANPVLTYRDNAFVRSVVGSDGPTLKTPLEKLRSPFGKWEASVGGVVSGSTPDGGIILFTADISQRDPVFVTPAKLLAGPQSLVTLTPNGMSFASAGPAGTVTVFAADPFDPRPKQESTLFAGPSPVRALAFSQDGTTLAAATLRGDIVVWGSNTGAPKRFALKDLDKSLAIDVPAAVDFSPDGKTLAVGTGLHRDGKVVLIDIAKGSARTLTGRSIGDNDGGITNVQFGLKGAVLLVEYDHRRGAIVDVESGKARAVLPGTIVPSADGEWVGVIPEAAWNDPRIRPEVQRVEAVLNKKP